MNTATQFRHGPAFTAVKLPYSDRWRFVPVKANDAWAERLARVAPIAYGPEFAEHEGPRADRYRWIENAGKGLRIVGDVHEIARQEGWRFVHSGWYTDPFGNGDTVCGAVLQLPGRERRPVYVPAIRDPNNDGCYCCDFHNRHDDLREAILDADSMAERYAEREREYQLAESAKLRAEELRAEARELRAEHWRLIWEIRITRGPLTPGAIPTICAALRGRLAEMRQRVREALQRAAELDAEPWKLLEG